MGTVNLIMRLLILLALLVHSSDRQMVHGSALPLWTPTYQMNRSTFIMACNNSGSFNPEFAAQWGIADFDWSNWKYGATGWTTSAPMDCQEKLLSQAQMTKQANPSMKVFVYRNMVKALPWYSSVREKLLDPAYSGFFLKFNCNKTAGCHVPTQGSLFYHDQEQTPHGDCGVPCGEYLFDHRNGSMLQEWFIKELVGGPTGIDNPAIDGFYFDDNYGSSTGASEEDSHNIQDCGLSEAEAAAVAEGWKENTAAVGKAVLAKGGFPYPYFVMSGRNETDPHTSCQRDMQRMCAINRTLGRPNLHNQALVLEFSRVSHTVLWHPNGTLPWFLQDLATFLLVRGPFAWLGYTWSGCTDSGYPAGCDPACTQPGCKPCRFPTAMDSHPFPRPDALDSDFGEPVGQCHESSAGVWTREWSKASVELNCNSFRASILKK